MKIIGLTRALRQELKSHRDEVAARIASFTTKNGELASLIARQEKLSRRIAALEENADLDNRALIQELAEKKVELGLVEKKVKAIGSFDSLQTAPEGESLGLLLHQSGGLIGRALAPTETAFTEKIARAVRGFCVNDDLPIWLARNTQAVQQLASIVHRKYNQGGASIGAATAVVQLIDQVLSGEIEFVFNANLENSRLKP